MQQNKQNIVALIDSPRKGNPHISFKAANMFLNRFCVDEDAAFELSEVLYLNAASFGNTLHEGILKGTGV